MFGYLSAMPIKRRADEALAVLAVTRGAVRLIDPLAGRGPRVVGPATPAARGHDRGERRRQPERGRGRRASACAHPGLPRNVQTNDRYSRPVSDPQGQKSVIARVGGRLAGEVLQRGYAIGAAGGVDRARSSPVAEFRSFGAGSAICFPVTALYGERYMSSDPRPIVGPHSTISCGVSPDHDLGVETALRIGDRCLIGRGSGIVAHESIEIGDDVFTGHSIYVTDANHGYEDPDLPVGRQFAEPKAVSIGAGLVDRARRDRASRRVHWRARRGGRGVGGHGGAARLLRRRREPGAVVRRYSPAGAGSRSTDPVRPSAR